MAIKNHSMRLLWEHCRQMVNDPNQGWAAYWTVLTPQQRLDCWINETVLQNVHIQEESDGVLHKTTQQMGTVLAPLNWVEAKSANHEELLNHTGTTTAYEQVWSGRSDPFFLTN